MEYQQVWTNGVTLHVVQDGPRSGPLVLLLHGFPDFWYGWRHQIPHLAAAGYRVWVPDQRGYNLSEKPKGIAAYRVDTLAADVVGLIDAAGEERAFVVGHDWGAGVAWWVAAKYPQRVARMVIVNVPHAAVMEQQIRRNLAQLRKSWYFFFFQIPRLPEVAARWRMWSSVVRALQKSSRPGTFTERDIVAYRAAWSQPNAYRSMVNWYRAALQQPSPPAASPRITVPTLLIWGVHDQFLGRELARPSIDLCDDGQLVFFEDASHWVQHEEPARVNALLVQFLRGERVG